MSTSTLILVGVLVYLGLSAIWSIIFRRKVIIRFICALAAMAIAFAGTFMFKGLFDDPVKLMDIVGKIPGTEELLDIAGKMTDASEPLAEVVTGLLSAAAAPAVFMIIFSVALSFSFILRAIISFLLFIFKVTKKPGIISKGLFGVGYGLIVLFCLLVPMTAYMEIAEEALPALNTMTEDAMGDEVGAVMDDTQKYVEEFNDSAVVKIHGVIGGSFLRESLTSIKLTIGEEKVKTHLAPEVGQIVKLAGSVMELTKVPMDQYTEKETEKIESIAASLPESKLLSVTVSEFVYLATDAWMKGESVIGIAKPSMGEDFDPLLDKALQILHDDSKNIDYLSEDLTTVAKVVAKIGAYTSAQQKDETGNAIKDPAAIEELMHGLLTEIGNNERMRPLIPLVTNIGLEMLASTLGLPSSAEAAYTTLCEDIARELSSKSALSSDERITAMESMLKTTFSKLNINVGDSEIAIIASSLISHFKTKTAITSADADAYLTELAAAMGDVQSGTVPVSSVSAATEAGQLLKQLWQIKSNDSLSPEEKAAQSAQAFASSDMVASSGMTPELIDTIKNIIIADANGTTPDEARRHLQNIAAITDETHSAFGITLQDILVDPSVFDDPDAISDEELENIINAVSDVFGKMITLGEEDADISEICKSLGSVLDTLESSPSFYGEEKTDTLVKAILTSETVRASTGISHSDIETILEKRSENDVSYSALMGTVSETADIFNSIENGSEITEENINDLMDSLANDGSGAVIAEAVTEEKLKDMGFEDNGNDGAVASAAQLIANVFRGISEVSDPAERAEETEAVKHLINIAFDAKNTSSDTETDAFGDENARLGCTAEEMVNTILGSSVVTDALDSSDLAANPFGLSFSESDQSALSSVLQEKLDNAATPEEEHTVQKLALLLNTSLN